MCKKLLILIFFSSFTAFAADKALPNLTIYTYDAFALEYGPGPILKKQFEKSCACQIDFVGLADANLILPRLDIEKENSPADIVIGVDNLILNTYQKSGYFEKYDFKINKADYYLPELFSNDDFVPYDFGWLAFVYNSKKTNPPPSKFNDWLISQPKIVWQDPRTSTPGLTLLAWVHNFSPADYAENVSLLNSLTIGYPKGWSESYQMFLNGEVDFVWSYTTSPLYHQLVEKNYDIKAYVPTEGTPMQVEYAAVVKSSKNKALANKFLKFLISTDAQNAIPKTQWIYPISKKAKLPPEFKKSMPDLKNQAVLFLNNSARNNLIDLWQEIIR